MSRIDVGRCWRLLRPVLPPALLAVLVFFTLREPLEWWLSGEEKYDQEALREWIRETRINQSLSELVRDYLNQADELRRITSRLSGTGGDNDLVRSAQSWLGIKREEIYEFLQALGNPTTKMYRGQLPLFPVIFRLSLRFDPSLELPAIVWDSELPRQQGQYRSLKQVMVHDRAWVNIQYHLHAYSQRQAIERQEVRRRLWLSGLGLLFAVLAIGWIYLGQRRARERQQHRLIAEQQMSEAERLRLQEELRRQEAERRQEEAERLNLELKSQLFANIGIMAGSYAHNIKNLLVRPNDLLRRCLEDQSGRDDQARMLHEVKQTLGTVTERLQQILQTVRRDPSRSEKVPIDINKLLAEMHSTWGELARDKWKLDIDVDLCAEPLWIDGDLSHLQQAVENLLFNARDATFEMRNHLRERARRGGNAAEEDRRQALIAAAGWRGRCNLRSRKDNGQPVIEVGDNGIGMTEEVRKRCTETHFSTKRNNALFAGLSAGMGLGLSFVTVILEHHGARLEIDSTPLHGTTFRARFPGKTETDSA
ncbi:MAG: HAMP domain-containing histidine kinase [Planctomycetes bacterium]|nr:HAMP domain-containing histidine kinase [Planctomycetota bacterium]